MTIFMPLHSPLEQEILYDIEIIANGESLFVETNFMLRSEAIDDIGFHVIDRLQLLAENTDSFHRLNDLKHYAEKVRSNLEEINTKMFRKLRAKISLENYRGTRLMNLMNEYLDHHLETILQQ